MKNHSHFAHYRLPSPTGRGAGGEGRSLKDLAGILTAPVWDGDRQGIKAQLRTTGPSGSLLENLAREMLGEAEPKPDVGFSADILFTAKDKTVTKILRVLSVDSVFDPARGGAFLRALNITTRSSITTRSRP